MRPSAATFDTTYLDEIYALSEDGLTVRVPS